MNVNLDSSWKKKLENTFSEPYFLELVRFIKQEYRNHTCYPPGKNIFSALDDCPLDKLKVVIIGQDPYHGKDQAHGYCFSVPNGVNPPPSLINIFKELKDDLNITIPTNGDLTRWSKQGVLLLNSTLTVRENLAGSHQNKGWEVFTDKIIETISSKRNNIVFLLWGSYAKSKAKLIDKANHLILTSGHPSPLSANRGYWFGNKHFSKTNSYLKSNGFDEILW
ncbi:MAG: uracil-DNA glycosylase [Flavobacteriaceae bacterium]|nr:uracil-DNA glycosylase [Flavobacteriaceae bacterium]